MKNNPVWAKIVQIKPNLSVAGCSLLVAGSGLMKGSCCTRSAPVPLGASCKEMGVGQGRFSSAIPPEVTCGKPTPQRGSLIVKAADRLS